MTNESLASALPIYRSAIDWQSFCSEYPLPDVFAATTYRWSPERVRELQNERFLKLMEIGWRNAFYRSRWRAAGLEPGDIRNLDDIIKLPTFTSDDVKESLQRNPPYGDFHGVDRAILAATPFKLQTSGGTTGTPRGTLSEPKAWEAQALTGARAIYIQGGRPGDVMQLPMTCSLANAPWLAYKACHDFLGILPLTTGSGVVTSSRQQLEIAFRYGTNLWTSFPEYLMRLAQACRDELGRDVRELNTKFIRSYLGPDLDGTLRRQLQDLWGCPVYDTYGTHEIGTGGFECPQQSGLHFMEDAVYMEVVDVDSGKPVAQGERGNLVATVFFRSMPPVIRYNLRDLGRIVSEGRCECGSHFRRMDHLLGRSDAMVKLRGVNVYPMACLSAIKSEPRTTGEWVCIVERVESGGIPRDEMEVQVEVRRDAASRDGLREKLERRLKDDLGVSVRVSLAEEGSLAELANTGGREGKARRLIDRRPAYRKGP
jgi:phenylacetate-CoA ligase